MNPLSTSLIQQIRRSRFNPIRSLTPQLLSSQLESFGAGTLRDFALTAQAIEKRDDVICVALPKRKKAPARRGYAVQLLDGLEEGRKARAAEHQDALKFFWDNLTVGDALEGDVSGGFKLLVRQMMNAVGLRYAVHEITWQPRFVEGRDRLTATFTHVPLQFFEAATGRLRFLRDYLGQVDGEAMDPLGWMVTVGEGILEPLAVCYMFKQLSLKDWVSYNERFGTPGVLVKTDATQDSPAWKAAREAAESFAADWSAVMNEGATLELVEAKGGASLPFPALVERMDRAIATICRGADLSTMSAGDGSGQGASLQGDEGDLLEQDDAEMITETLQRVDKIVIRELFGEEPLAYVQIQVPKRKDSADTRANLTFLRDSGVPVSQEFVREQFSVPAPLPGAAVLTAPAPAALPGQAFSSVLRSRPLANASAEAKAALFKTAALRQLSAAQVSAIRPLIERLVKIADLPDAEFTPALDAFRTELPALAKSVLKDDAALVAAFQSILGTALVSGAAEGAQARKS